MLSVISPVSVLPSQPAKRVVEGFAPENTSARQPYEADGKSTPQRKDETSASKALDKQDPQQQTEAVLRQLKQRDQQVRAHEMAHLAAAGAYATSAAQYVYQTGPDGRKYAIGGEVGIDVSPERDPEATIRKMQTVQRAALAPADPSPQDMRVAALAAQQMMQAQQALRKQEGEQKTGEVQQDRSPVQAAHREKENAQNTAHEIRNDDGRSGRVNVMRVERYAWETRLHLAALRHAGGAQ